jgi:hypothetical protein
VGQQRRDACHQLANRAHAVIAMDLAAPQ